MKSELFDKKEYYCPATQHLFSCMISRIIDGGVKLRAAIAFYLAAILTSLNVRARGGAPEHSPPHLIVTTVRIGSFRLGQAPNFTRLSPGRVMTGIMSELKGFVRVC